MKRVAKLNQKKRLHVFWSGRVQGVGFRYTAQTTAMDLKLAGWVRNLQDGRVEALCEGPEEVLKAFLDRVTQGPMRPYIRQTQVDWLQATGEFPDFRVRFL